MYQQLHGIVLPCFNIIYGLNNHENFSDNQNEFKFKPNKLVTNYEKGFLTGIETLPVDETMWKK